MRGSKTFGMGLASEATHEGWGLRAPPLVHKSSPPPSEIRTECLAILGRGGSSVLLLPPPPGGAPHG